MSLYSKLTLSLGSAYRSPAVEAVLADLPVKRGLRKDGGYRASLTFKRDGLYFIFEWRQPDWILTSAMLFPEDVDGFSGFAGAIEGRLSISSDRGVVHRTFGAPARSGGSGGSAGVLKDYVWDRYDFASYSLRFDYVSPEGMIHLATTMTTACARALNPDMREKGDE